MAVFCGSASGESRLSGQMGRDFLGPMGFTLTAEVETKREYKLGQETLTPIPTKIKIIRRAYEPS